MSVVVFDSSVRGGCSAARLGGAKESKHPTEPVASKTLSVAEEGAAGAADEPMGFAKFDAYLAEARYFNTCEKFPREARRTTRPVRNVVERDTIGVSKVARTPTGSKL